MGNTNNKEAKQESPLENKHEKLLAGLKCIGTKSDKLRTWLEEQAQLAEAGIKLDKHDSAGRAAWAVKVLQARQALGALLNKELNLSVSEYAEASMIPEAFDKYVTLAELLGEPTVRPSLTMCQSKAWWNLWELWTGFNQKWSDEFERRLKKRLSESTSTSLTDLFPVEEYQEEKRGATFIRLLWECQIFDEVPEQPPFNIMEAFQSKFEHGVTLKGSSFQHREDMLDAPTAKDVLDRDLNQLVQASYEQCHEAIFQVVVQLAWFKLASTNRRNLQLPMSLEQYTTILKNKCQAFGRYNKATKESKQSDEVSMGLENKEILIVEPRKRKTTHMTESKMDQTEDKDEPATKKQKITRKTSPEFPSPFNRGHPRDPLVNTQVFREFYAALDPYSRYVDPRKQKTTHRSIVLGDATLGQKTIDLVHLLQPSGLFDKADGPLILQAVVGCSSPTLKQLYARAGLTSRVLQCLNEPEMGTRFAKLIQSEEKIVNVVTNWEEEVLDKIPFTLDTAKAILDCDLPFPLGFVLLRAIVVHTTSRLIIQKDPKSSPFALYTTRPRLEIVRNGKQRQIGPQLSITFSPVITDPSVVTLEPDHQIVHCLRGYGTQLVCVDAESGDKGDICVLAVPYNWKPTPFVSLDGQMDTKLVKEPLPTLPAADVYHKRYSNLPSGVWPRGPCYHVPDSEDFWSPGQSIAFQGWQKLCGPEIPQVERVISGQSPLGPIHPVTGLAIHDRIEQES